jgi:hypothetical protein
MIDLTHDDIIAAIGFYLEARGASADLGTIEFTVGAGGLSAKLDGELAEVEEARDEVVATPAEGAVVEEVLAEEEMLSIIDRINGAGMQAAFARAQRVSRDSFTGEELPRHASLIWIEGVGVTRAPLEKWPSDLREKLGIKKGSEARTAADILGGGGDGPIDRLDALSRGMKG